MNLEIEGASHKEMVTESAKFGRITWRRIDLPHVRLQHVQHLLLLQGLTLAQLFPPEYVLLRATASPIWMTPCDLQDVVLAAVLSMETEEAPLEEVALELMRTVYSD